MQDITAQLTSLLNPLDVPFSPIIGLARPDNIVQIVVNKKIEKKDQPPSRDLIALTEKLADEARSGTLKGLAGLADYGDGYDFWQEGSYLSNPGAAVLPLARLERRIMDQIEDED